MKISLQHIVVDHLKTLNNARTNRLSSFDIVIFYGTPCAVSYFIVHDLGSLPENFYGLAISVFSIFAALLFSVQIALFNILQRNSFAIKSSKEIDAKERRLSDRNELLREVNANISYLILISSLGVAALLLFSLAPRFAYASSTASVFFITHFVLTILLVISRVHTLFDEEYNQIG